MNGNGKTHHQSARAIDPGQLYHCGGGDEGRHSSILVPFFLAVFIAVICTPPLLWLQSKGVPKVGMRSLLSCWRSWLWGCSWEH